MELKRIRSLLENGNTEFTATYMAVCDLRNLARSRPRGICPGTVSAVARLLAGGEHATQKQAFFLYREAARVLTSLIENPLVSERICSLALSALRTTVRASSGPVHKAASEAMGSLPLRIEGPEVEEDSRFRSHGIQLADLLKILEVRIGKRPSRVGRSLVAPVSGGSGLLVIKTVSRREDIDSLQKEAAWMECLATKGCSTRIRFDIPRPLRVDGYRVFRLDDAPCDCSGSFQAHPASFAVAFLAHRDYFFYINGTGLSHRVTKDFFKEVLCRNAWLMGHLASAGIIHTAPIPLFHNRVQRDRRSDGGLYEWTRGGRLDRWLESCAYPNFGPTGLRDFEHLVSLRGSGRRLYQYMGTQVLSLLLVAGSFFRNKDPVRIGFDAEGRPVDARGLFDEAFLAELVESVFRNYYGGFVGRTPPGDIPFDSNRLSARMIEEMGVDRYMEEILRVADQKEMTDTQFRRFLEDRGIPPEEAGRVERGAKDITVLTGPHLGGFNDRISLPEVIDFAATTAACCVADRFAVQRSRGSQSHARLESHEVPAVALS